MFIVGYLVSHLICVLIVLNLPLVILLANTSFALCSKYSWIALNKVGLNRLLPSSTFTVAIACSIFALSFAVSKFLVLKLF